MFLLSAVVAGMLVLFVAGRRSVGLAGRKVQALDFARDAIEELKGRVGGDLWPPPDGPDTYLNDTGGAQIVYLLPPGDFRDTLGGNRTYTVEDWDVDGDNITDYKNVTVTVTWFEP